MPTFPAVGPETLQGLIDRLDLDSKIVQGSTTVNENEAQTIQDLIAELQGLLRKAKADLEKLLAGWNSTITPRFGALTPLLVKAFNLNAVTDQGACTYDGHCFVTTRTICEGKGTFTPGVDCNGNPIR
jgi:hypothetical protein